MRALYLFGKHGWRVVTETHTALWLIGSELVPATTLSLVVKYILGFSWWVMAAVFLATGVLILSGMVLFFAFRNKMTIEVGADARYNKYRDRIHILDHTIRVGIKNNSMRRRISHCNLELTHISGSLSSRCPIAIASDLAVNAGAEEIRDFVTYPETTNEKSPPPDNPRLIHAHFPINPLPSNGQSYLDGGTYEITLLLSAEGTAPWRADYRLLLGPEGKLSLKRIRRRWKFVLVSYDG
jgi:hypothetical protein